MEASKFLQAAILVTVLALAASCRTSRTDRPTRDYPVTTRRYPYPDQNPYPDRRAVERRDPNPQNLPPGQAKKNYGGRSARPYAPGQRKKLNSYERRIPLIIKRTPDIVINRNSDGRYYHRSNDGFLYWQGYDDRFYIDQAYLDKIKYDENEYKDWSNKGKGNSSNNGKDNSQKDRSEKTNNGKRNGKGNNGRGHQ